MKVKLSYRPRADNRIEARGWINGKRESGYGKTRKEAHDDFVRKHLSGVPREKKERNVNLVKDVAKKWDTALELTDTAETTRSWYRTHMKIHIVPKLGEKSIASITREDVEALLLPKTPATRCAVFATLRSLLEYAETRDLFKKHPMRKMKRPKSTKDGEEKQTRNWTTEESQKFARGVMKTEQAAFYLMVLGSGVRRGEAFGLRKRDINFAKRQINICNVLVENNGKLSFSTPKTRSGLRTITLPKSVMMLLKTAVKDKTADDLVFPNRKGQPWRRKSFDDQVHYPLLRKLMVARRTMHEIRHTHGSLLLDQGENIKVISERLGHADIAFTLRTYAHLMPRADGGAALKMERLFTGRRGQPSIELCVFSHRTSVLPNNRCDNSFACNFHLSWRR